MLPFFFPERPDRWEWTALESASSSCDRRSIGNSTVRMSLCESMYPSPLKVEPSSEFLRAARFVYNRKTYRRGRLVMCIQRRNIYDRFLVNAQCQQYVSDIIWCSGPLLK